MKEGKRNELRRDTLGAEGEDKRAGILQGRVGTKNNKDRKCNCGRRGEKDFFFGRRKGRKQEKD